MWQRLQTPPPDGGLWNSRKVAEWMSELLERPVSKQRGWEYLRGYELRLKQPRPAHTSSDPIETGTREKKLKDKYQQLCRDNPNAIVELWSMDEHRLGLKPISMKNLGRNWGKSDSRCELEVSMAVVVWFCGSPVRRNLLLDSTLCQ